MPTSYLINRTFCPPQIKALPNAALGIIVVIPCFNETGLLKSLAALYNCDASDCAVEIIVVINDGERSSPAIKAINQKTFQEAQDWALKHHTIRKQFHILYHPDLPAKKAGVGLARKIGMDEAALRLEAVGHPEGIITGFDADSLCASNYFVAIENHFKKHPDIQACSIKYAHPLIGKDFDENIHQAIAEYELHLRYFTLAKRFAAYPHAFETIGSSMAVRADAYQQQGGMNTRKAGEDFYFLNKFMVLGKLNELNETFVIPSPRISDRVPFGTGKAVGELLENDDTLSTYAFQSFIDLKTFIELVPQFYRDPELMNSELEKESHTELKHLPPSIADFFKMAKGATHLMEIRNNTTDYQAFEKRFFRWFDPFMIMKYVHYARDHFYPNIPVAEAGHRILKEFTQQETVGLETHAILKELRKLSQVASQLANEKN